MDGFTTRRRLPACPTNEGRRWRRPRAGGPAAHPNYSVSFRTRTPSGAWNEYTVARTRGYPNWHTFSGGRPQGAGGIFRIRHTAGVSGRDSAVVGPSRVLRLFHHRLVFRRPD